MVLLNFCNKSVTITLLLLQILNFLNSEVDNIIRIGEETYRYFQFSTNLNGDMIIDLSSDSTDSSIFTVRKFYGLKNNGRFYFTQNNEETPFFSLTSTITTYRKVNSVSYFIQLSGDNYYGKECIFSLSKGSSVVDLYDLDNNQITSSLSLLFSRKNIASIVNVFFKSKYRPDSKYYYILAYSTNQNPNKFFVRREYFESTAIQYIHDSNYNGPLINNDNIVSCFETAEYNIVCLYQNSNNKLEIYGYAQPTDQGITQQDLVNSAIAESAEIFFKCIHHKDEIGVFMYYLSVSSTYPTISFKQYIAGSGASSYRNYFDLIELNKKNDFNPGTLLNDIMKISEDKICIASASSNKELLYLVILSLFEDDTKMLISYYSVDLAGLNHKIYKDIKLYLYNNFITFGFSHCITNSCDDSDAFFSSLIIFNYPKIADSEANLDLLDYLEKNNNDIGSLNINLTQNIIIQNNIFGYEISATKIISISDNLNLYYKNNKTTILKNYIVPNDDFIKISLDENINSIEEIYSIEYTSIVRGSSNGNFFGGADDYDFINFNDISELEIYYEDNIYLGKSLYYNISLQEQLSNSGCTTEECSLCYNNNKAVCAVCKNGYYYNDIDNKCIPIPEKEDEEEEEDYDEEGEEEENNNKVQTTILSTVISTILTTTIELTPTTQINEEISTTIPKEKTTTSIPMKIASTFIPEEMPEVNTYKEITSIPMQIASTFIPEEMPEVNTYKEITSIPMQIAPTFIPEEMPEVNTYKEITSIPMQIAPTFIPEEMPEVNTYKEITYTPKEITTTVPEKKLETTTFIIPEEIAKTMIPIISDEIVEVTTSKEIHSIFSTTKTDTSITSDENKYSKDDIYENICSNEISNEQIKDIYTDIKEKIFQGKYNSTNNTIYKTKNVIFHVATIKEQKNENNINISSIDFDECEKKIKEKYKMKEEDDLIIFKTDIHSDNSSAIYVQYEIYDPNSLALIPLDICEDVTININIPIFLDKTTESLYIDLINSGYNLFDSNDSFYNDICKTYTTENGTDITLLDRKAIIYENNKDVYLCQEGCSFTSYNETTKKSKCNCSVQNTLTITDIKEIKKINKKEFVNNFVMNSLKNSNFRVVKCYKLVLSLEGELNNYGSYILIGILFILIVCMICYCFIGNKKLSEYIQQVIKLKFNFNKFENTINKDIKKGNLNKINMKNKPDNKNKKTGTSKEKDNKKNTNKNKSKKASNKKKQKSNKYPPKRKSSNKIKKNNHKFSKNESSSLGLKKESNRNTLEHKSTTYLKKKNNSPDNKKKSKNNKPVNIINYINDIKIYNNYSNDKKNKINNKNIDNELIDIKTLNDEELNSLEYSQAVLIDKRSYFEYYFSLLKKKHLILFTFLPSNDYNLIFIKISLLLLAFSLYFTINAFFFTDKTMHKITVDHGTFDIIYQIPQILYSTVISSIINMILKKLSLSELQILAIKRENDFQAAIKKGKSILNCLKIKFIIFYILNFIFSSLFWYFIACFCAVYKNTQIILIKNTFLSFGLSMLYPFGLNLLPGVFRIPAVRATKKDRQCLYKFSKLVAII